MEASQKKEIAQKGPVSRPEKAVWTKAYLILPLIGVILGLCVTAVLRSDRVPKSTSRALPQTDVIAEGDFTPDSETPALGVAGHATAKQGPDVHSRAVQEAYLGIADTILRVQALEKGVVTQMLADFPDSVEALHLMAFVLRHHGDSESASAYYEKVLTSDPQRGEVYQELAQIARERGQLDRAAEILSEGLDKAPNTVGLYWELAEVLFRQGYYARALPCLEKERDRTPDLTRVHYLLGQVYSELQQYDLAQASFKAVIDLDPNHLNAYYGLGTVYAKLGERDLAREALLHFQHLQQAFQAYVDERDRVGDVNEARRRAAKLCFRSHLIYLQHQRPDMARKLLETAVHLDPMDALFVETRALVAYRENQFDLALQLYDKARQLDPTKASNSLNLSKVYQKLNQPGRAEPVLKDALTRFPNDARIHADLARLYLRHPVHVTRSIPLARRALQLEESAEGYYLLSLACMANQDKAGATQAIKKAVELAPNQAKYRGMYDQIKDQP